MESLGFTTGKAEILEMTAENVDLLHAMWMRMFGSQKCGEYVHKLKGHLKSFFTDLLTESRDKEQTILGQIAGQRAEATELARLLHLPTDFCERPDDVPLVIWELKFDKTVEILREELVRERAEVCQLLLEQEQLCVELGEVPLALKADPLPLPEQKNAFRDHLEQLRAQRVLRLEEMDQLRQSIKHNMKLLECLPQTDLEKRLLNQVDPLCVKPWTFQGLRRMQKELADQMQEMREHIDDMREKIYVLWERLQVTDGYARRRVREATEYTKYTYNVLREELQRCLTLRRRNLKSFIKQLRAEIKEWWNLTLKSPEERKRFTSYFTDLESEDVLEQLERELNCLKVFYYSNMKIFELYANRTKLWSRMKALEAKANDPNRFNNRGGQLLREEKERNAISVKLPKTEKQITELVNAYVSQANTPFLVFGEDILGRMALDWEEFRRQQQQPSAARKKQELAGAVSRKIATSPHLTPKSKLGVNRSSSSLKKSPPKMDLSNAAKSTGNLKKKRHSNFDSASAPKAKRNLITSLDCNNSATVFEDNSNQRKLPNPPKKVYVLKNSLRRVYGTPRSSVSGVNPRRSRPIPQIRIEAPSSEDSGSS